MHLSGPHGRVLVETTFLRGCACEYLYCGVMRRVRVPGKNFVVVSDAKLLPAIIGRPGLPKTALYQMTRPVSPQAFDTGDVCCAALPLDQIYSHTT